MNNPWLFPLPEVVNPPTLCIQIEIPNDQNHIAAFLGMIEKLSIWFNWDRDAGHTGLAASNVWKLIFYDVAQQIFKGGDCPVIPPFMGGEGVSTEMSIRQNPDNPCLLESSIDGVEWCVFADLSKCIPGSTQPGAGSPVPGSGQCQKYHAQLPASSGWYAPPLVSSGDTISVTAADGATNDGGSVPWRCADGGQLLFGQNTEVKVLDGGDPLPTVAHLKLIAKIGGTAYDVFVGGAFTVPGGIASQQVVFQVNDSALGNNQGQLTFDVEICNNATGSWEIDFDFTSASGGWVPDPANGGGGVLVPSVGWQTLCQLNSGFYYDNLALKIPVSGGGASTVTYVEMTYDMAVSGGLSGDKNSLYVNSTPYILATPVSGANQTVSQSISVTGVTEFKVYLEAGYDAAGCDTGIGTLTHIKIRGTGPKPTV